ncbi:MAG: hypothetical protein M1834_002339 [Cirrosporium novae-zelandiae]|nr:MAG: hypothetical protein M1834_002339 [Cirrosporium novae-zelandiae]
MSTAEEVNTPASSIETMQNHNDRAQEVERLASNLAMGFSSLLQVAKRLNETGQEFREYASGDRPNTPGGLMPPTTDTDTKKNENDLSWMPKYISALDKCHIARGVSALEPLLKLLGSTEESSNAAPIKPSNKITQTQIVSQCPFSSTSKPAIQSNLPSPLCCQAQDNIVDDDDPIGAEFHHEPQSPKCCGGPCNTCPIRLLNKHSPEEVAQYVEKHKHEIPRSHLICIKRFQGDPVTAAKIDAKYGDMTNMMQSLGMKHQPLLPHKEQGSHSKPTDNAKKIEKWVENVSESEPQLAVKEQEQHAPKTDEERVGHFEKPLRNIRVGESPSRPWGITIPATVEPCPSVIMAKESPEKNMAGMGSIGNKHAAENPKRHFNELNQDHKLGDLERNPAPLNSPHIPIPTDSQRQIIYNGPIFVGYSPEAAGVFLREIGYQFGNGYAPGTQT